MLLRPPIPIQVFLLHIQSVINLNCQAKFSSQSPAGVPKFTQSDVINVKFLGSKFTFTLITPIESNKVLKLSDPFQIGVPAAGCL